MAQIYVTDETKDLIEKVCKKDKRTQDGEINFLCSERAKELGIPAVQEQPAPVENLSSVNDKTEDTDSSKKSQQKK